MKKIKLSLSVNNLTDFSIYEIGSAAIRNNGKLPFVEILWDNYCYLKPDKLIEYLSSFSDYIAFHIMWSRFLDRDQSEFKEFLEILKVHVAEINPIYVSDHICTFQNENAYVKSALEKSYTTSEIDDICTRIDYYQNYINRQLLLENFASMTPDGEQQVELFDTIINRTGCGVLLDISNVRVAYNNGYDPIINWIDLLKNVTGVRCHVGGYEYNTQFNRYRDSHGDPISAETLSDIKLVFQELEVESLCYEREHNRISEEIAQDLELLKIVCG